MSLLLAYRLLYFCEKIPDIELNIKGREKQLFKPILRIFQNSEILNELLSVIGNYVTQKREANDATFNAFLYRAIIDIIEVQRTAVLPSRVMWDYITSNLEATEIPGRNLSCETTEFGLLTKKEITQILVHVFGAKPGKFNGIRSLDFDVAKLQRLGRVYDLSIQVEVIKDESSSKESGSDRTDVTNIDKPNGLESYSESEQITHENKKGEDDPSLPYPSNVSDPTLTI